MTLKEKIHKRIWYHTGLYKSNLTNEISELTDDYAIDFLNWYISKSSVLSIKYIGKTAEELLEIYKKEL